MTQRTALQAHASRPHSHRTKTFAGLVEGLSDTVRLVYARLSERLPLFAGALIGGTLVAVFSPSRSVATVALVVSTTVMVVAALAFGVRALRDDPTRTFLFSRPLHGAALFWGEFIAALATAALLGGLAILPGFLRAFGDAVQTDTLTLFGPLLLALPFAFSLTHTLLGLGQAKPRWWIVSITFAAITVVTLGFVSGELGAWSARHAQTYLIIAVVAGIGLAAPLLAGHRRAAIGRHDNVACHRTFFRTFWTVVAAVLAIAAGLWIVVDTTDLRDLEPLIWQESRNGRWLAVGAHVPSTVRGPLGSVRRGAETQFVLDTDTGAWTRLRAPSRLLQFSTVSRRTVFSADGDTLFWTTEAPTETTAALIALDLASGTTRSFQLPAKLPYASWWIGPDDRLLIAWDTELRQRPEAEEEPTRRLVDRHFRAYEIGSALPFATWTWSSERRTVPSFAMPKIISNSRGGADILLTEQSGAARFLVDSQKREVTRELDLQLRHPTDRTVPERVEPVGLLGLQWGPDNRDLWVAHERRLFRLDSTTPNQLLDSRSAVHEEPADRWIVDLLVLPERFVLITTSTTPRAAGDPVSRDVVVIPRGEPGARRVVATVDDTALYLGMRLASDSLFLGPFSQEGQRVLVLGTEPGTERLLSVANWAVERGLPATESFRMPYGFQVNGTADPLRRSVPFKNDRGQIFLERRGELVQLRDLMRQAGQHRLMRLP